MNVLATSLAALFFLATGIVAQILPRPLFRWLTGFLRRLFASLDERAYRNWSPSERRFVLTIRIVGALWIGFSLFLLYALMWELVHRP